MIKNLAALVILWASSLFLVFFVNSLLGLSIDFLWASSISVLLLTRNKYSLLVIIFFGLTLDNWIMLYPGIYTLSNLLLGIVYLRIQDRIQQDAWQSILFIVSIGLISYKLFSFILILIFGNISLFHLFISWQFWLSTGLTALVCYPIYQILAFFQNRLKLFYW